jgi:hypothetical protein
VAVGHPYLAPPFLRLRWQACTSEPKRTRSAWADIASTTLVHACPRCSAVPSDVRLEGTESGGLFTRGVWARRRLGIKYLRELRFAERLHHVWESAGRGWHRKNSAGSSWQTSEKASWSSNLVSCGRQTMDPQRPPTLCESGCEVLVAFPTPHGGQTALQTRDLREQVISRTRRRRCTS